MADVNTIQMMIQEQIMLDLPHSNCKIKKVPRNKRGQKMKKLMKIGLALSIVGFIFYFLPPNFLDEYSEMGRSSGSILFAFGWALLLGSFVFNLGMEAHKKHKRD